MAWGTQDSTSQPRLGRGPESPKSVSCLKKQPQGCTGATLGLGVASAQETFWDTPALAWRPEPPFYRSLRSLRAQNLSQRQSITQKGVHARPSTAREREHWFFGAFEPFSSHEFQVSIARTRFCAILPKSQKQISKRVFPLIFFALLDFLASVLCKEFLACLSVFPFVPNDFGGSARIKILAFLVIFPSPFVKKQKEKKIRVWGSAKKSSKIPQKVQKWPRKSNFKFFGPFLTFWGIFGDFFRDPPRDLLGDLFAILGPETLVNGGSGRNPCPKRRLAPSLPWPSNMGKKQSRNSGLVPGNQDPRALEVDHLLRALPTPCSSRQLFSPPPKASSKAKTINTPRHKTNTCRIQLLGN